MAEALWAAPFKSPQYPSKNPRKDLETLAEWPFKSPAILHDSGTVDRPLETNWERNHGPTGAD